MKDEWEKPRAIRVETGPGKRFRGARVSQALVQQDRRGFAPPSSVAVPDLPPGYVLRELVIAQLDAAVRAPLTLVTAPAGWGKTAALVAWARTVRIGDELPVVRWVTSHSPDGADVPGRLRGA